MADGRRRWWSGRDNLANRLVLATAVQLLLVGVTVGAMTWMAGRRSGLELAEALRQQQAATRLSDALAEQLAAPRLINRLNALAIAQGELSLADFDAMGQRFWRQMSVFPGVGYINWGSTTGAFLGVERRDDGSLVLNEDADGPVGRGNFAVYSLDERGRRGALLEVIPGMSATHEEPWYTETVQAGRPIWSSIYQWEDNPEVFAIAYNQPITSPTGDLQGVIGVDFVISQLNTWLAQLWADSGGLALILEPNGQVVASSRSELSRRGAGATLERPRIDQLEEPLLQAASSQFFQSQGATLALRSPLALAEKRPARASLSVRAGSNTYLLNLHPWGQQKGLDWLLLTAIPADQAMASSQRGLLISLVLSLVAVLAATLLTRRTIRWLLAPLEVLRRSSSQAREQLQHGNPELTVNLAPPPHCATEIAELSHSFQALVHQLADARERERLKDAQTVLVLQAKLRSSLEAAAIAHEINLPLSTLLLHCQLLQQRGGSALPDPVRQELGQIEAEAQQVVLTIEKMRSLLRNVQTHQQPLQLAEVVRSALLYARPSLLGAGITVTSEGLDQAATVAGDGAQIQIAVVNLLRNAMEAIQSQGRRRGQVLVRLMPGPQGAEPTVLVAIEDDGPGFRDGQAARSPLSSDKPRGSGLGLFVVQTTMENHRGQLRFTRSSGLGGAAVVLSFPRVAEAAATSAAGSPV